MRSAHSPSIHTSRKRDTNLCSYEYHRAVAPRKLGGGEKPMAKNSRIIKRSLIVGGHKTSVSLEDVFWEEFRSIACERGISLSELAGGIDSDRQHANLSSALRLFVLEHRRIQAEDTQNDPKGESVDSRGPRRDRPSR